MCTIFTQSGCYDWVGIQPTELKIDSVVQGKGVTHLNYSFIK